MVRATGAGKVQELPRQGFARILRKGLLFNFDIEGDAIKNEHKQWLTANVVPLLTNSNLTIRLRGMASRSGSDAFNKALSERRLASVRQFLIGKGGKSGQFQTVATGEDDAAAAGAANGTEDEKFRGVVVTVVGAPRTAKVKFEQVFPSDKENGFDTTVTPNWLMVPHEGFGREIRVVNGMGLRVVSRNPAIAVPLTFIKSLPLTTLESDDEVIRVRNHLPGTTFFDVVEADGSVLVSLEVAVLPKLQVKSAFHYVQHSTVGTLTRNLGDEKKIVEDMNKIYLAQANIEFVISLARNLPLTDAFGSEINESTVMVNGKTEWEQLTKNRQAGARFNVFFVRELEQGAEGLGQDTADALATIGGVDCVFEDDAGNDMGETVAHEAGHSLGCRHNSPITSTQDMLMWDTTDQRGRFIPKVHAELMRQKV